MKMYSVDRSIVNPRLRPAQRLKNRERSFLRMLVDRSLANNFANLFQSPAVFMSLLMRISMHVWRGGPRPRSFSSGMLMASVMIRMFVMVVHRFGLGASSLAR